MSLENTFSAEEASFLLDIRSGDEAENTLDRYLKRNSKESGVGSRLAFEEVLTIGLACILQKVGVQADKADSYAEAVIRAQAVSRNDVLKLLEDETQELYCLIEDYQLARTFLRSSEDDKEMDVGAEKPVLLPITKTEINVSRALRPILVRVRERGPDL